MALLENIRPGMRVRVDRLNSTQGMLIESGYLKRRRVGAEGVAIQYVAGHGGDVWWVEQDDGIAVYSIAELSEVASGLTG